MASQPAPDPHAARTLRILSDVFGSAPPHRLRVRLWDGTSWPDETPGEAILVLRHPGALRAMLLPATEVGLAEAYLRGDFDVQGNIEAALCEVGALKASSLGWDRLARLSVELRRLPPRPSGVNRQPAGAPGGRRGPAALRGRRHSIERDAQAIAYHYDVSNDFYRLWLDERMVYSCAYFTDPAQDLDTAQMQKLDYICRKLRLRPGMRLLDIGCGWGGLVIHAARHWDVDVTGITLSRNQTALAQDRLVAAGLSERARVRLLDWRELDEFEAYDALVSVGMFEHVGAALLPKYFAQAHRLLKPGGVFLNHGISAGIRPVTRRGPSFTERYVFPDGELVPVHETLRAAAEAGFEARDLESLREHYALTLRHWVRRLEARHEAALAFVDEPTYRVWRLFMAGSAYGFSVGSLNVYQVLLVKPDGEGRSGLPLTRADWYR